MNLQNVGCIYCGNPRPSVLRETQESVQTGLSLRGLISRNKQRFQVVDPTPLISCILCNRRYYLFALQSERDFINDFLENYVMLTDNVIDSMNVFNIPTDELARFVVGITQPEGSKNMIHIVICYSNHRYFISCEKSMGKYLALNFEKVVIE